MTALPLYCLYLQDVHCVPPVRGQLQVSGWKKDKSFCKNYWISMRSIFLLSHYLQTSTKCTQIVETLFRWGIYFITVAGSTIIVRGNYLGHLLLTCSCCLFFKLFQCFIQNMLCAYSSLVFAACWMSRKEGSFCVFPITKLTKCPDSIHGLNFISTIRYIIQICACLHCLQEKAVAIRW